MSVSPGLPPPAVTFVAEAAGDFLASLHVPGTGGVMLVRIGYVSRYRPGFVTVVTGSCRPVWKDQASCYLQEQVLVICHGCWCYLFPRWLRREQQDKVAVEPVPALVPVAVAAVPVPLTF